MDKLGLIAGGGALPLEVAAFCERAGRPLHVVRLKGLAAEALKRFDGQDAGLAEFGKILDGMRKSGVAAVCLAGIVNRPNFSTLVPDLKGMAVLPGVIAAAGKGDDTLLRHMVGLFEREGFRVEGATDVVSDLLLAQGPLGRVRPGERDLRDAARALDTASRIGALDIGQGAVVCAGLVLAVEAQEGTDEMLRRVGGLRTEIRGSTSDRRGVLAKVPKPIQERRVDLPTIGVSTVEAAAAAGLAGIAGEAGGLIVLERESTIAAADRLGLFIWGAPLRGPEPG